MSLEAIYAHPEDHSLDNKERFYIGKLAVVGQDTNWVEIEDSFDALQSLDPGTDQDTLKEETLKAKSFFFIVEKINLKLWFNFCNEPLRKSF